MDVLEAVALFAAGVAAGTINTVVGSGSLVTFPVLVALGYPPVVANVTNTVGLVPGSFSGAYGYRGQLPRNKGLLAKLLLASLLGGLSGALLLLRLPPSFFAIVVPYVIGFAVVLVLLQPRLKRIVKARKHREREGGLLLLMLVFLASVYGGYFSAAQGILLLALLGLGSNGNLQQTNALKNVAQAVVNSIAALVFIFVGGVEWPAVAALAVGTAVGGRAGAYYGSRLPPTVLRALVVVIGIVTIFMML